MKLLKICALFSLLSLFACDKDDTRRVPTCENCNFDCTDISDEDVFTNDCKDNFDCTFAISANSKFDDEQFDGVGNGDKNVFQITTVTQGDPAIADDEFSNILVFELPAEQKSFDADGSDLAALNAHFRRICFCSDTDFKAISEGCMQGLEDENGDWFVQGNLEITYSWGIQEVKFDVKIED